LLGYRAPAHTLPEGVELLGTPGELAVWLAEQGLAGCGNPAKVRGFRERTRAND